MPTLRIPYLCLQLVLACLLPALSAGETGFDNARRQMIDLIAEDVRQTSVYLNRQLLDERVMQVLGSVPRHAFVPEALQDQAYENRPLTIGHGQTISQPYIVAIMTDLLDPRPGQKALEIGTGSGFQAGRRLSRLEDQVLASVQKRGCGTTVRSFDLKVSAKKISIIA